MFATMWPIPFCLRSAIECLKFAYTEGRVLHMEIESLRLFFMNIYAALTAFVYTLLPVSKLREFFVFRFGPL